MKKSSPAVPADLLEPELEKYREEFKDDMEKEEDVFELLALFPQVAMKFFEARGAAKNPQPKAVPSNEAGERILYVEDLPK